MASKGYSLKNGVVTISVSEESDDSWADDDDDENELNDNKKEKAHNNENVEADGIRNELIHAEESSPAINSVSIDEIVTVAILYTKIKILLYLLLLKLSMGIYNKRCQKLQHQKSIQCKWFW